MRDGHADLLACARHEGRVRRRPVQVKSAAETAVPGGEHPRHAVGDDPEVADPSGVEHRVEVVAVGPATLTVPTQRGARRTGEIRGRLYFPARLRGAFKAPPSFVARSSLLSPGGAAPLWLAGRSD